MDAAKLFDVKSKVVVVTGGGRGIGRHIAQGFVENGAKVYITSRDAKVLDVAAKELNALGKGKCIPIAADLSKFEEVERFAADIGKREEAVHVLVNNAGNNWGAELAEYPDAAWNRVIGLNLQRVFTLTQKLTPLLEKGVRGSQNGTFEDPARIINIGSIDGLRVPTMETYAYSASKAGLHHLSRVFAHQLSDRGITSNTIACGAFESKMMKQTLESFGEAIKEGTPLGRIGTGEDITGACLFLSSRAGAWVTGTTIPLDGGVLIKAHM